MLLKILSDRCHQRHGGFSLLKYSIGYIYWPIRSCFKIKYHCLVLSIKTFGQVFPAFGQLNLSATSPNEQVSKLMSSLDS